MKEEVKWRLKNHKREKIRMDLVNECGRLDWRMRRMWNSGTWSGILIKWKSQISCHFGRLSSSLDGAGIGKENR